MAHVSHEFRKKSMKKPKPSRNAKVPLYISLAVIMFVVISVLAQVGGQDEDPSAPPIKDKSPQDAISKILIETEKSRPEPEKIPVSTDEKKASNSRVIVIINIDDINEMLVVTTNGDWIHDAREIEITGKLGSEVGRPKMKCTTYNGLFQPTNPKSKEWEIENFVTADNQEFQDILDGLQNGQFLLK